MHAFAHSTAVLFLDERWCVRQIALLSLGAQCEETQAERARAICTSTTALAFLIGKGIQAIVNRYLVAPSYRFPGDHMRAFPHGVWIAGVIEIASWREEDRTRLPVQFAEMALFLVRE